MEDYYEITRNVAGYKMGDIAKVIKEGTIGDYIVFVPNRKAESGYAPNISIHRNDVISSTEQKYKDQHSLLLNNVYDSHHEFYIMPYTKGSVKIGEIIQFADTCVNNDYVRLENINGKEFPILKSEIKEKSTQDAYIDAKNSSPKNDDTMKSDIENPRHLKHGDYYKATNTVGIGSVYIRKHDRYDNACLWSLGSICITSTSDYSSGGFLSSMDFKLSEPTMSEIEWLERCIKATCYLPKDGKTKSSKFKVGDKVYITDHKELKEENSIWSKKAGIPLYDILMINSITDSNWIHINGYDYCHLPDRFTLCSDQTQEVSPIKNKDGSLKYPILDSKKPEKEKKEESKEESKGFFIEYHNDITENVFDKIINKLIQNGYYREKNTIVGEFNYDNFKENKFIRTCVKQEGFTMKICIDNNDQSIIIEKKASDFVDMNIEYATDLEPIKEEQSFSNVTVEEHAEILHDKGVRQSHIEKHQTSSVLNKSNKKSKLITVKQLIK